MGMARAVRTLRFASSLPESTGQIAVRAMDFHHFETGIQRPLRSGGKSLNGRMNLGDGQFMRRGVAIGKGNRTGCYRWPSIFIQAKRFAAAPRNVGTGLASRVRQLDTRHAALLFDETRNPAQGRCCRVQYPCPRARFGRLPQQRWLPPSPARRRPRPGFLSGPGANR